MKSKKVGMIVTQPQWRIIKSKVKISQLQRIVKENLYHFCERKKRIDKFEYYKLTFFSEAVCGFF